MPGGLCPLAKHEKRTRVRTYCKYVRIFLVNRPVSVFVNPFRKSYLTSSADHSLLLLSTADREFGNNAVECFMP